MADSLATFSYTLLLSLLNPLAILGMSSIGLLVLFSALATSAYFWWVGETSILRKILLWWVLWAGITFVSTLLIRYIIWKQIQRMRRRFQPAEAIDTLPLVSGDEPDWEWSEEKTCWHADVIVEVKKDGIYAWRLDVEDTTCHLHRKVRLDCSVIRNEVPNLRNSYQLLYRFQSGRHTIPLDLIAPADNLPKTSFTRL